MKFEGVKSTGADKDIDVYLFTMRKDEIALLRAILEQTMKYIPKITETTIVRGRAGNMLKVMDKVWGENNMGKRNF